MIGSKPRAVSKWWGEDVRTSILNSTSISMSSEYKSKQGIPFKLCLVRPPAHLFTGYCKPGCASPSQANIQTRAHQPLALYPWKTIRPTGDTGQAQGKPIKHIIWPPHVEAQTQASFSSALLSAPK